MSNQYEEAEHIDLLDEAKMLPPKPARRVGKGLKAGLVVAGAILGLGIFANIASLVFRSNSAGGGLRPLTMTKQESDDYARQQRGLADFMGRTAGDRRVDENRDRVMGNAAGLAGDPRPDTPGAPPTTAQAVATQKSEAELQRDKNEALAMLHRQNDLDSSPTALDFSDYFERGKETALLARAADTSIPTNRDAYDALDAASAANAATPTTGATPAPVSSAVAAAQRRTRGVIAEALNPGAAAILPQGANAPEDAAKGDHDPQLDYVFDSAFGKLYRLMEDTIIETVLVNRLAGASNGPVITMVTTDVYSMSSQHLLIPRGTRLLGTVSAVGSLNQERLFVAFHRAIMPDGYSVSLDKFKALDVVGQTGLHDLVNHHYAQIFGASLAVAAMGAVTQIGNNSTYGAYDWGVEMRNGITQGTAQAAQNVMQRFLNILPTFTIRERSYVKVMLSNDLLLPDTKNHTMDPDL